MKKNLLSTALIALTALFFVPQSGWADEATISTQKVWTFDDLSTTVYESVTGITVNENVEYYLRAGKVSNTMKWTKTLGSASLNFTNAGFSYSTTVNYYLAASGNLQISSSDKLTTSSTAGGTLEAAPMFAFNNAVAGTVYAAMKTNDISGKLRIYHTSNVKTNSTELNPSETTATSTTDIQYIKYAVKTAGSFFIGDTKTASLYAVCFVPETVTAPTISYESGTVTITPGTSSVGGTVTTYYTTDGSTPTTSSAVYDSSNKPTLSSSCTVKAISVATVSSDVASKYCVVKLASNSISFASASRTVNEYTNFNVSGNTYTSNTTGTATMIVNDVTFAYSNRKEKTMSLVDSYFGTAKPATITIPGVSAGQTVFLRVCGDDGAGLTLTPSGGSATTINTYGKTSYGDAADYFTTVSSAGDLTLTAGERGVRLFRVALANKLTTAIEGAGSNTGEFTFSPVVSTTPAVDDANLGNGYFVTGTSVTVTAPEIAGYTFSKWLDNETSATHSAIKLDSDKTLTAIYTAAAVPAPTIKNNNGTVTITKNSEDSNVTTYYTTGASPADPTSSSTPYATAMTITSTTTIKAINYNSTSGTYSDVTSKTITIPTALTSNSVSFAGLTTVTLDDATNFTQGTNSSNKTTYEANSNSACSISANGVTFVYARDGNPIFTLADNCISGSKPLCSIVIPGLTAGQTVFARVAGNNSTTATTFTCTDGSIDESISSSSIASTSSYGSASDLFITVGEGKNSITLQNQSQGFNLFRIALANKVTASVATEGTGTVEITPTQSSTPAVSDNNLGNGYFVKGSSVTLTATPESGYEFVNWTSGSTVVSTSSSYTITNLAADQTLTANFQVAVEKTVSTTKTWTFNDLTIGNVYSAITPIGGEYYLRASTAPNRTFTVTGCNESLTFADGTAVTATNYITSNSALTNVAADKGFTTACTAGYSTKNSNSQDVAVSSFAVNTTKPGTLYAFASTTAGKKLRIYFNDGTNAPTASASSVTVTPETTDIVQLSFTSTAANGGTFFVGSPEAAYNIYAVRFVPTDEAVTYKLTMGSPANATISATIGETTVASGKTADVTPGSKVTLIATPEAGYQLSGWKDGSGNSLGDIPTSIVTTVTMPVKALTANATFTAQPTTPKEITAATTWTFDSFTAETALSGKTAYEYNGLYISGHDNASANLATVKTGSGSGTLGGETVSVSRYLSLAGGQGSESLATTRTVNTFTKDAIAFRAGVPGTVYVLMQGAYVEGRTFNIYVNGTRYTTDLPSDDAATVVSQYMPSGGNVFIATSAGLDNIYAVRFVPAKTYDITIGSTTNGTVTADMKTAAAGATVTLTVTPKEGYDVGVVTVTKSSGGTVTLESDNTFKMPSEAVTVTATFVEGLSVKEETEWKFDKMTTGETYGTIGAVKDGTYNSLYARGSSARNKTFTVTAASSTASVSYGDGSAAFTVGKTLTQTGAANNPAYIPSTATALTSVTSLTDGSSERKDCGVGMLAINIGVEGTVCVIFKSETTGENGFRMYHKDSQSTATYPWTDGNGNTSEATIIKDVALKTTDGTVQSILANVSPGTVFFGDVKGNSEIFAVKFMPLADTDVTLTETDGTKNRKDFKNLKVNNLATGATLYYILPGETATRTFAANDSMTIVNIKKNGYLTYWVSSAAGVGSKKKTVAVKVAPSLSFKSVSASASTYTLNYTAGNTLHYMLPGGKEQTASGGTSEELTVTTTGTITTYQTVDDVTSATLSTTVYAPTPAIADNGKYDFSLLKDKIGSGYTIAIGSYLPWGDEVTIGNITLKKPGLMTAKTLDRFAFTSENSDGTNNTNWRLVSDGRLRVAKRATAVYMAILDVVEGEYLTISHNNAVNLTYQSSSTAKLEDGTTTLTSGETYRVKGSGHILLSVSANADKEFDITQIEIASDERVTAPTLEARTENGEVVPNAVTLRMGVSNFGRTVKAYYTTDGTTPTAESTEMTASGKITVDETCTIRAICISESGIRSSVSEYSITLPQYPRTGSVVYDIAGLIGNGKKLEFSDSTTQTIYLMEKGTTGWEMKGRSDFYPVTNLGSRISVRAGAESITYDEEKHTIKLIRPMAIHDLGLGDEIVIVYSGSGSLISVNSERCDEFTVDGSSIDVAEEISSGKVMRITKTKYVNNYIVVSVSGDVYIYAIYINSAAPKSVTRPKVALHSVDGDNATYRFTFDKGSRLYYQLSTEESEMSGSDTGTYDLTIDTSAKLLAWATKADLVSDTLSTVIFAPTPEPSEDGDYDFAEPSENLPSDMEVTLDENKAVTIGDVKLYKTTALTQQTFGDKFAFTETNTTGKIKIRTNRSLAFNKGTDMNMGLLNMKRGDIISFDFTGTMKFVNPSQVARDDASAARTADGRSGTRAVSETLESGVAYVVQTNGNILLSLELTDAALSIAKMYVAAAPEPSDAIAVDFATAGEEEEALELGGAANVWCNERTAMVKFNRFINDSEYLPIGSKVSTENGYGTNTSDGFKSGNRNIAIHALAKGDEIKVRFYGGEVYYYGHETYGNRVSVNGKVLAPGDVIKSGDVLTVEQVDYLNNYVVLRLGSGAAVSGIFINAEEMEKVLMPTITAKGSNTALITGGKSTTGNHTSTYYTTNGTDPSLLNGTGGPYSSFEIQFINGVAMTIKAVTISETGLASRITTILYDGTNLTAIDGVRITPEETEKPTVIYDLTGRRVEQMIPGRIYIVNGKKVISKKR